MDQLPVSPLKPRMLATLEPVSGLKLATGNSGTRYKGRDDVTLAVFPEGTTVAGVFTKSKCPGAPVDWSRKAVQDGMARALLVNAGNANAFTGAVGVAAAVYPSVTTVAVSKFVSSAVVGVCFLGAGAVLGLDDLGLDDDDL